MSETAQPRLFTNGRIFTGQGVEDFAAAFSVADGRILEVFDSVPDGWQAGEVVDLAGATVLPGLLDVHTHPSFMATLDDSVAVYPPDVGSLDELLAALATHPDLGAGPQQWVRGHGFDETKFPDRVKPTAADLDTVAADQPVLARRCDGHTIVVNSRALELAGITRETPDPPGGRIERDDAGEPTGVLSENSAMALIEAVIPASGRDDAERIADLDEHFLSRGIVGVNDLYASFVAAPLDTFRRAQDLGFGPQAVLYPGWDALTAAAGDAEVADLGADERSGRVRIGGVKLFMDGAFSDRNAWNEDPYPGSCSHGGRVATDEEMAAAVDWARRNRVQVAFHAMGDRALNHILALFGDDEPWMGELPSIRLDHASLFSAEMVDRLRAARMSFGVISHTVFFFAEYEAYAANLTDAQLADAYPIRRFYERVDHTALASDAPATAWSDADDVFLSIRAAVERRSHSGDEFTPDQAVSVGQAVLLYTARAAEISGLEGLGRIRPGAEASFVVLDRDLFALPAAELSTVGVAETWLAGEKRYSA